MTLFLIERWGFCLGRGIDLGEKMAHQSQFAGNISCIYCEEQNNTNVWPLNGDSIPFYFEEEKGNYSIEICCPNCGGNWFVVWDYDPGPIITITDKDKDGESDRTSYKGSYDNPQLYLALKISIEEIIKQGTYDFEELFRFFEKSYSGVYNMEKIFPLFKRIWNELH
jgi:hypothetical protein